MQRCRDAEMQEVEMQRCRTEKQRRREQRRTDALAKSARVVDKCPVVAVAVIVGTTEDV
jgi:hypothetical protein